MDRCLLQKDGGVPKQPAEINAKTSVKRRKYKASYLNYGFTSIAVDGQVRPQCVVCAKTLPNNSMGAIKLRHHLQTRHASLAEKKRGFFARKLEQMNKQRSVLKSVAVSKSAKAVKASYQVALLIAKNKQPYEDWQGLIFTAATEMCRTMIGGSAAEKFVSAPQCVWYRICNMCDNITDQLVARLQSSQFALQLDHASNLGELNYLVAYVRYCHKLTILEDFLFCNSFQNDAPANEVFDILNDFLDFSDLTWEACVGISTDAGSSLAGCLEGLKRKVLQVAPHVSWTCSMIHRETLVNSTLAQELQESLQTAIKDVTATKEDSEMKYLSSILCEEMGNEHLDLFKTDSYWLSRGQVLQRLYEHKVELRRHIMHSGNSNYYDISLDPLWLVYLAYLADIFNKLNSLSISTQGPESTIFHLHQKLSEFKSELDLWKTSLDTDVGVSFPLLAQAIEETQYDLWRVVDTMRDHLKSLRDRLDSCFPEDRVLLNKWVQEPFKSEGLSTAHLPVDLQEQLINLRSDMQFKMCFERQSLEEFWLKASAKYPALSKCAIAALLPFSSTSFAEIAFSTLVGLRTMYNSSTEIEYRLRLCLSKIQPQIDKLTDEDLDHLSD